MVEMNPKHGLLTENEKVSLENDIHRINNNDLKQEILNGFGQEFAVKLYFSQQFTDELVLNAYEFFSVLIKCNITYNNWFYKQGEEYNRLINLSGKANVKEITWEKKEVVSEVK
ncbi:hypothetical protein [Halanaerobacter jeridensis]|uniref:Uncharacterized protein n=1 Tax=Halanaerobacter jeridensis TaxID=706427 RepID=A0A939BPR7_9FIRM|nr:hypothetical protein [Halanaerobacter jeridensis]MBM7555504.1 hypothetical protein [Halanaerobacter jeridensis]